MSLVLPIAARSESAQTSDARLSGLTLALVATFLFALSAFSLKVLGDGDTWSHLATGEWILAHGAVPHADPFSHSMPGAPWTAHEWLSEILLTLAFRCGGWNGVVLLTGAAAAGAALIVGLRVARDLRGAALAVTMALGAVLVTPSLLARPHVLALPLLAAWSAGLFRARDRGRRAAARARRADDPVVEHAWRLHLRPGADRPVRARGARRRAARGAPGGVSGTGRCSA